MRKISTLSLVILISVFSVYTPAAFAQQTGEEKLREEEIERELENFEKEKLREEEIERELKAVEEGRRKPKEKISVKSGGWFSSYYRMYKDTDNDKDAKDTLRATWEQDLRLWTRFVFDQRHIIYLRLKNSYVKRFASAAYTGTSDNYDGPHLDTAYLKLNSGPSSKVPWDLTLGRQHLFLGRGISYSQVNDGAKFTILFKDVYLKALLSQPLPHDDNIDSSVPNYDKKDKRVFYGAELTYLGIPKNAMYLYYLIQRDKNEKYPEGGSQNYIYDSQYLGLGLEGKYQEAWEYWLELIREDGKSYTDTTYVNLEREDINAFSANTGMRYTFDLTTQPSLELEYGFGSGDKDRANITNTKNGGNRYGKDKNFLYFGDYFVGYSLSPRLSNLHVVKCDFSLKPFATLPINLGAKYYLYLKDKKEGGISDLQATAADNDVGEELNLYLYWQISKQIYWSNRFGIFFPGDAYPKSTNDKTTYFFTQITLTF